MFRMKNNMYDWIDKTRNFIAGECPHKCHYCYVKKYNDRNYIKVRKQQAKYRKRKKVDKNEL